MFATFSSVVDRENSPLGQEEISHFLVGSLSRSLVKSDSDATANSLGLNRRPDRISHRTNNASFSRGDPSEAIRSFDPRVQQTGASCRRRSIGVWCQLAPFSPANRPKNFLPLLPAYLYVRSWISNGSKPRRNTLFGVVHLMRGLRRMRKSSGYNRSIGHDCGDRVARFFTSFPVVKS
jgi:hypothetical protein